MASNESSGDTVAEPFKSAKGRLFRSWDKIVKLYFGGSAFLAILILLMLTLFLFKEALIFFPQENNNLKEIRRSGNQLVLGIHSELDQYYNLIHELESKVQKKGYELPLDKWDVKLMFQDGYDMRSVLVELQHSGFIEDTSTQREDPAKQIEDRADRLIDQWQRKRSQLGAYLLLHAEEVRLSLGMREGAIHSWRKDLEAWMAGEHSILHRVHPRVEIGYLDSLKGFFMGERWITNSYNQNVFGVLPLLHGTILVSLVSLSIAAPFGIACALYVSHFSGRWEKHVLKPALEFIAAFPTVFLGFIGVVFLGDLLQGATESEWLSWLPVFPIHDRINAFTAGVLLAIMSIPIIFTLAEDALHQVPVEFSHASYSVGATKMQTLLLIVIPIASQGILSAVLLGFARVIGETMIVLLVAGNQIQIPPWETGPFVVFESVHTMTGVIAQEMGEVTFGGIHYRALFLVGAVLFTMTLALNFLAEHFTKRLRKDARLPGNH